MGEKDVIENFGVPYGSRTRVAAVKEKQPTVIQRNLAAWIALHTALEGLTGTLIGLLVDSHFPVWGFSSAVVYQQ
jgi:hypothetical protein